MNEVMCLKTKRKTKNKRIIDDKSTLIYFLCTVFYCIRMFYLNLPIGVICGLVIIFVSLPVIFQTIFAKSKSRLDIFVYLFIFLNILSIVHYTYNQIPLSVFFSDALSSFVPIVFYYLAKSSNKERVYSWFCYITSFVTIIGIILFLTTPSFYIEFLRYSTYSGRFHEVVYEQSGRMCSIYNSTIIGILCCYAVAVSLDKFLIRHKKAFIVHFVINLMGVFFCYQRSSYIVCAVVIVVYFLVYMFRVKEKLTNKIVLLGIFIVACFVLGYYLMYSSSMSVYLNRFFSRTESFDTAFSERTDTWIAAIENTPSLLFGSGLGSVGHHAMPYSEFTVRDGNYIKILCENGIIGLLLFAIICLTVIISGFKKKMYCEVAVIFIMLLHSVGSNTLSLLVPGFLFWYAIGSINSKSVNGGMFYENNRRHSC